jgi:hypothetical protein
MIGAVSEFGKVGLTVIGNDPEEVDRLYTRTIGVLDAECALGHVSTGYAWPERGPQQTA